MRRMYFLARSTDSARRITDELLLGRIIEPHIHILTHTDHLPDELPEEATSDESDFMPALFKGLGVGALTGLAVGILIAIMPYFGIGAAALIQTPFLAIVAIFGALMGAFAAAIVGVSVVNPSLERFEKALDEGRILVMADVPRDRVDELAARIQQVEPQAEYCGMEPLKPAFP